jgi:hypothetical protein
MKSLRESDAALLKVGEQAKLARVLSENLVFNTILSNFSKSTAENHRETPDSLQIEGGESNGRKAAVISLTSAWLGPIFSGACMTQLTPSLRFCNLLSNVSTHAFFLCV